MRLGCLARWGARRAALCAQPGPAAHSVFQEFWVVLFPGGLRMVSSEGAAHGALEEAFASWAFCIIENLAR